jgi:hypothetical protein
VCERESESERESVCVCERVCVCVRVSERGKETESERGREYVETHIARRPKDVRLGSCLGRGMRDGACAWDGINLKEEMLGVLPRERGAPLGLCGDRREAAVGQLLCRGE